MSNMKQPTKRTRSKAAPTSAPVRKTTRVPTITKETKTVPLSNGVSKAKVAKLEKEQLNMVIEEKMPDRKRKVPKVVPPLDVEDEDMDTTMSKVTSRAASKRQKIQLEVPKLPSTSGVLFVIGSNDVGQLGLHPDIMQKTRPVEVKLPNQFVDVAAGGMHSVCLTDKGEVYTFGCNDEGALGRPTEDEEDSYAPRRVEIPGVVVRITAGDSHSAALTEEGQVYIWGNYRNGEGPMGLLSKGVKQCSPVPILKNLTIVNIASGNDHLLCLTNEGVVYSNGCAEVGQLGRATRRSSRGMNRRGIDEFLTPKPLIVNYRKPNLLVDNIWTASYASFVRIKNTKEIYSFGLNNFHQLGFLNLGDETSTYRPRKVASFSSESWQRISGGQHHVLALHEDGRVFSVGRKEYGRLGLGEDAEEKNAPTVIPTLENVNSVGISSGNVNSFSVSDQGCVYSWGMGDTYMLGHGTDDDCHTPKIIEGNLLNSWHAFKVSGGGQHTLVLANRKAQTENKSTTDSSES